MAQRFPPYYAFTPHGIMMPPPGVHLPPPRQLVYPPSSTVPAKRESDDVQFVSANPVKKQKLDHHPAKTAISSHPTSDQAQGAQATSTTQVYAHTPLVPTQAPAPAPAPPQAPTQAPTPTPVSIPAAVHQNTAQPLRDLSAASYKQPSVHPTSDPDPSRGCSVPVPGKSDMFEHLWTAPSTSRRSSTALSPKQLPQHISPALLQLPRRPSMGCSQATPSQSNSTLGMATTSSAEVPQENLLVLAPQNTLSNDVPQQMRPPVTPNPITTAFERFDISALLDLEPARSGAQENPPKTFPATQQAMQTTEGFTGPQTAISVAKIPSAAPEQSDANNQTSAGGLSGATNSHQPPNTPSSLPGTKTEGPVHILHTSQSANADQGQQSSGPAVAQSTLHDNYHAGGAGSNTCTNSSTASGKAPCVHCLQKRLRQAVMISSAASMASGGSAQGVQYGLDAQNQHLTGTFPQVWPPQANMTPFTGPFTFGQGLPHHLSFTSNAQQNTGSASNQAPVAPMSTTPAASTSGVPYYHPPWYTQAPSQPAQQPPTSTARVPQTQYNGKHIIVDIAETCVEVFPFDEVAQRHNQPVKKVREIFEAIIQMPLMRCPTDKRRAGKQATARVKEYTQARRELAAGAQTTGTEGSQGQKQQQQQPSAWEVAQFMGPSDVRVPGHLAFGGPW